MRFLLAALFLSLGTAPVLGAGGMGSSETPSVPGPGLEESDPLGAANAAFRKAYADLRTETLAKADPVIYAAGDDMVLIRGGKRSEAHVVTRRYHELKAVAHVPLTLYVMLVSAVDAPLEPARLEALRSYRGLVSKARDSLKGRSLGAEQRARGERMLDLSLKFIDGVFSAGKVSGAELKVFTRAQRADIEANTHDAARDQIETMDAQMGAWLGAMTPEERSRLRAIVGGSHMPREGNIASQYFSAKLGNPPEDRLIYGEGMWDEAKAFNLLAAHPVDAGIGDYFFDDVHRMHRDLLADAAGEILRGKFGKFPGR